MRICGLKKNPVQRLVCVFTVSIVLLSGCGSISSSNNQDDDVVTLKKTNEERTQITVLVKYAFGVNNFEKIVEEKFPDIDIVQVGNYTANTTLAKEYEARLKNDDLTDIVLTWPYDVGETYWKDRLIDLSGMSFSSRYNASMLDSIASESGALYYLPGPAQIRGIVYNKTMFNENGWEVPTDYNGFVALCKEIEAGGHRAFQLPLGNTELLDTAFIGFNYGTAYSKPTDTKWLADYNNGKGKFMDHFSEALVTFQNLIDEGILKKEDLDLTYSNTQENLANRKTVMTEDSVVLTQWANSMSSTNDDYALMPFFSRVPSNDWSRIYMTCYIGLNKHLQEDKNKDKYEKVLDLMDYISTSEGQKALASDNGASFSSLRNVEAPDVVEIHDLTKSLSQGRYGVFPTLTRSESSLRYGLKGMLLGNITSQQVADMVDRENMLSQTTTKTSILGKASEDFSFIDTGNFLCDMIKEKTDADIALFLDNGKDGKNNGKGISAKFYKGELSDTDIDRVFPDLKHDEKGELSVVEMTGNNLLKALEYTLPVDNQSGWFYYFSGLNLTFHPTNQPGSRISDVTLSNGKKLDKAKVYNVAIMKGSVNEDYIQSMKDTDILIKDLLRETIQKMKIITPNKDERFIIEPE